MQLRELQQALQDYILNDNPSVKQLIVGNAHFRQTRLDIYANAYLARLLDILRKQYPVTESLLGQNKFTEMAEGYLTAHPSQHYSVRHLGRSLLSYLTATKLFSTEPYVAELIRFETALADSIDAADAKRLSAADLTYIKAEHWSDLKFQLHPSVITLALRWNIPAIWQAYHADTQGPELKEQIEAINWMIWRGTDLQSYFVSLNQALATVVTAIQQAKTFAEICDCLCEWLDEEQVPAVAMQNLHYLITNQLLAVTL